jgi:hypothetical protein
MSLEQTHKSVAPEVRQRFDQTFMELLAAVRVEVLEAKAPAMAATSQVAAMFFKESQQSVLRELAELVAAWNSGQINVVSVQKALVVLEDMGLTVAHERLKKLLEI